MPKLPAICIASLLTAAPVHAQAAAPRSSTPTADTQGLKLSVGRRRPDQGRYSFPSGHASATFATADVVGRQ